jgi:hypothetical protein
MGQRPEQMSPQAHGKMLHVICQRELQTKVTVTHHHTPAEWPRCRALTLLNAEGRGAAGTLHHGERGTRVVWLLGRQVGGFSAS